MVVENLGIQYVSCLHYSENQSQSHAKNIQTNWISSKQLAHLLNLWIDDWYATFWSQPHYSYGKNPIKFTWGQWLLGYFCNICTWHRVGYSQGEFGFCHWGGMNN